MTDPNFSRRETTTVVNKGLSGITIALIVSCVALLGVVIYGAVVAVDDEPNPSQVDVEMEAPEVELPEMPEVEVPEIEAPELPEAEVDSSDLKFDEPEFDEPEAE